MHEFIHVRPLETPTKYARSLGRFNDEMDEERKEETSDWENKDVWVWAGAPWGMVVMSTPKRTHTLLPLRQTMKTWVVFGQGRTNLEARPKSGPIFP